MGAYATAAKNGSYDLADTRSYRVWQSACEKYGVDPNNAAFNTTKGEGLTFPLIRSREAGGNVAELLASRLDKISETDPHKWRELYDALKELVGNNQLHGSQRGYSFDDLVDQIRRVRAGTAKLEILTSAGNLYETVKRLM